MGNEGGHDNRRREKGADARPFLVEEQTNTRTYPTKLLLATRCSVLATSMYLEGVFSNEQCVHSTKVLTVVRTPLMIKYLQGKKKTRTIRVFQLKDFEP